VFIAFALFIINVAFVESKWFEQNREIEYVKGDTCNHFDVKVSKRRRNKGYVIEIVYGTHLKKVYLKMRNIFIIYGTHFF